MIKIFIAAFLVGASAFGAMYLVSNYYTSVTVTPTPVIEQRDPPPTYEELSQRYGQAANLTHHEF